MRTTIIWETLDEPAREECILETDSTRVIVNSTINGTVEGRPLHLRYSVECSLKYIVRKTKLTTNDAEITLRSDGKGNWTDGLSKKISDLKGCMYIDISVSPFTNTLPIRYLNLMPGQSADIKVVYIKAPELIFFSQKQRYTHLKKSLYGSKYRFEIPEQKFSADIEVDNEGFVLKYSDLFRRI